MGGKSQSTTTTMNPWKSAQPFLLEAMRGANTLFKEGGFAADPYQGNRVADPSQATLDAERRTMMMSQGGAPGTTAARNSMMGMLDPANQYRGMDAVRDNILSSAIPSAASMFSGSGMTNSSTAMEGVGRSAMEALAPFEYGAYNAGQDRMMGAAQMLPGLDQAAYMPVAMQGAVGAQQDARRQAQTQADMQKYYETEGQGAANFQPYLNAIMGLGGMGQSSTSTGPAPGTGLGPAVAGGLGMYGALSGIPAIAGTAVPAWGGILSGLAALSDARSKRDVTRIGALDDGTPVYRFRYRGGEAWHMGVMAQDVPQAVCGRVGDYAVIDYGRVG